jgi:hypothetical protein
MKYLISVDEPLLHGILGKLAETTTQNREQPSFQSMTLDVFLKTITFHVGKFSEGLMQIDVDNPAGVQQMATALSFIALLAVEGRLWIAERVEISKQESDNGIDESEGRPG